MWRDHSRETKRALKMSPRLALVLVLVFMLIKDVDAHRCYENTAYGVELGECDPVRETYRL